MESSRPEGAPRPRTNYVNAEIIAPGTYLAVCVPNRVNDSIDWSYP